MNDSPEVIDLHQRRLEKQAQDRAWECEEEERELATRGLCHLPVAEGGLTVRTAEDVACIKAMIAKHEAAFQRVKARIFLDICESASHGRRWAKALCARRDIPRAAVDAALGHCRGSRLIDLSKLVQVGDERGLFVDVFRSARVDGMAWAVRLRWEHGVEFDTVQTLFEVGELDEEDSA